MKNNEKIIIGYITHGWMRSEFVQSIHRLLLERPEKIHSVITQIGPYININRHRLTNAFLETDADWLLMLDTDVILDTKNYDVLINSADVEKYPILAGKYFFHFPSDNPPFHVSAQKDGDWLNEYPENVIVEDCHSVAAGLMIVHRSVFEKTRDNKPDSKTPWWWNGLDVDGFSEISEDSYFCEQVRDAGIPIAIHTGVVADHIRKMAVMEDYFLKQSVV
jgi:hypothetical protein